MRFWVNRLSLLLALLLTVTARAEDLSTAAIRSAVAYSAAQHEQGLIIIQHGKTRLRQFAAGHSPTEPLRIYSGNKAFWCLAALVAEEKGLLKLDDRVADTITEWRDEKAKSSITIRQLLNFTSGMAPQDGLHEDGLTNRDAQAIRAALDATPGSQFIYGPASLQVFHALLKRKLAAKDETPTHFLERRVLRPLGLGPQRYVADKAGNPLLAAGFMLSADQWLSMGQLMLRGGKPVVSSTAFQQCLQGTAANPAFGLGLWNNHLASRSEGREVDIQKLLMLKWPKQSWRNACLCKSAPADLIASIGSHGNRLYAVPSMDLLVLRQGARSSFTDADFLRRLFGKE